MNPDEPMVAVPAPVLAELLRVASLHPLVQAVGAAQRILRQAQAPVETAAGAEASRGD